MKDFKYFLEERLDDKHKVRVIVSKDGGPKKNIDVKVSASSKAEAKGKARLHLKSKGYETHSATHQGIDYDWLKKEEVDLNEGAYEKSEENKRSADSAKKQGDMFAHHLHMADHHDNLAQWHGEKGRHSEADRHAEKAEKHHELAMGFKEEAEHISELSKETLTSYIDKAANPKTASRGKTQKGILKSIKAIGGVAKAIGKRAKQQMEEGKKPGSLGVGWMIKKDPKLAQIIAAKKEKMKSFRQHVGSKIEDNKDKK